MRAGVRLFVVALCGLAAVVVGWCPVPALAVEGPLQAGVAGVEAQVPSASATADSSGPAAQASTRPPVLGAEITALRTAKSRTFHGSDGSLVAELFPDAANFRDAAGEWRAIDTAFHRVTGGGWQNGADSFSLSLPEDLGQDPVAVRGDGGSVALRLLGASGSASVRGDLAQYHEALNSTDVTYQSLADGVKESLVLASPAAPSTFRFHLDLADGLTPRLESDGSIAIVTSSGMVRFVLPAPTMQDASGALPGEGVSGSPFAPPDSVAYSLLPDSGGWTVAIKASEGWLHAADRQYPVTIDPSVTISGSTGDCTVKSEAPSQSFCGLSNLSVGGHSFNSELIWGDNALVSFNLSSIPSDSVVDTATFAFAVEKSYSQFASPEIVLNAIDTQWSSPTWNTARSGVNWTCAGGSYYGTGCTTSPAVPSCALQASSTGWLYCDLPSLAQDLQNGLIPNYGVLLRNGPTSTGNTPNLLYSGESSSPPSLYVQYQPNTGERSQYAYHDLQLGDQLSASVNLGNGNLQLRQRDLDEPGPDGSSIEMARNYSSLRARQNPTDYHELAPGWLLNMGRDVSLTTITGHHAHPPFGTELFIAGWSYHAPDGSVAPVADGTGPLDGLVPGGDGSGAHWNPGPREVAPKSGEGSCFNNGTTFPTVTANASNQSYVFEQTEGQCGQSEQTLPLRRIVSRDGNTLENKYNFSSGSLSELVSSSGLAYKLEANSTGHLISLSDPQSKHLEYAYEPSTNYLATYTDMAGKKTTYTYDSSGQPLITQIATPGGRVVKFSYEEATGRLLSITREDATLGNPQWTFAYDQPLSNPSCIPQSTNQEARYCTIETDPLGNKTGYTFDAWNRPIGKIDPLGQQDFDQYTGHSNLQSSTSGTGGSASTTTYAYAPTKEVMSSITAPTGYTTTTEYTSTFAPYLPSAIIDPQQHETDYEYATTGSLTRVLPQLALNPPGHPNQHPAPEKEAFEYGSPECKVEEGGGTFSTPHVLNWHESGSGAKTSYCYDRGGYLRETRPPSPLHSTTQTITAAGRPKETTDGNGNVTKLTYDGQGRVKKAEYSGGSSVQYFYDGDGNIIERIDPTGTTRYTYNGLGLLTEEIHPPGESTGTTTYTYYANGQLHQATGAGGTTTYTYNANDELKTVTDSAGTTTFCYGTCATNPPDQNPRNDLTEIDYPNGTVTSYQYDIGDRITNIKTTGPAGTLQNLTYSYQQGTQDRALIQTVTDSVANTCTQYTYDYLNRLTIALVTSGTSCTGSQVAEYEYGYDTDSNLTTIHHYGAVGITICSTTQAMNLADELTTFSNTCGTPSATYAFDGAGNQTAAGSTTAFGYNVRDQYASQGTATFTEAGRTNNELTNNNGTEVSQNQLGISATKPPGSSPTYYTRTPEGKLIDEHTPTGTYYYSTDKLGSITRLTNSSGQQVQAYSYDPYGNATATPETGGPPNPFLFQAGYQATGQQKNLLQFGARFFDPVTGRWTQQDPQTSLEDPTQANGYAFASDDPVNLTDPTGKKGGPGATCGHNSPKHKKCHEPRPSRKGEGEEICGAVGGAIGGWLGGEFGPAGVVAGGAAGAKAGEKACHE